MSTSRTSTAPAVKSPDSDVLRRIELLHYNLHYDTVTVERYQQAVEFIRACECVALWRLGQGELSGNAGFYLGELAKQIAVSLRKLTEAGDSLLARKLPPIVDTMQLAAGVFGRKLTPKAKDRRPIEELLKKHGARDLIQTFAALHPDWAELCGIDDGKKFLQQPEGKLRETLLSKETWEGTRNGKRVVEEKKHRLAQFIENTQAIRDEMQQQNINQFVEHLWHGRLWSGPGKPFEDCPWSSLSSRPPRANVKAWTDLIMPHLKQVTENDPMKLGVFRDMIAARRCLYDGQRIDENMGARLATAPKPDIWNQVQAEIRKAWVRMEQQAR